MKTVGVIQARMGSNRLYGKVMLPLADKPLLQRFIERVMRSELLDEIVLATTEKAEDDILCELGRQLKIEVFRGSENDLIERIYGAAKRHKATLICRLCADNPLIEPSEIDRIVQCMFDDVNACMYSNVQPIEDNGYPDGIGAEVYNFNHFWWVHYNIEGTDYREHPHLFYYDTGLVKTCQCPEELSRPDLKLDVNTQQEYEYIKAIYDKFGHNNFHFTDYAGDLQ